jgi:tetratricopeptide (TPR) repeat protein/transcriptional regulator with XRE-family HTH domain
MDKIVDLPFGALVHVFRKRRKLRQRQLAEQMGVHRNTIGTWERGDHLPESKAMVLELARQLRLDEQETQGLLEASLAGLPPRFSLPFARNPYFTGREDLLGQLHKLLFQEQKEKRNLTLRQPYALYGLGGIGKTQLAIEYAYRHALAYTAVFWIRAETQETILSSFLAIAELLEMPEREETEQQKAIEAVQRWFARHPGWLLIWDNVEDLDLFQQFLPPTRLGAILLTTRRQAVGMLAEGLPLAPMAQEEGMLFLLRRAKILPALATTERLHQLAVDQHQEYTATQELATLMDGLPLALDQAGAYMEETGCSPLNYLQRYRQQRAQLLARRGNPAGDHPHSVVTTLRLSYQQVAEQHPAALELLRFCVFLAPSAIPEELFTEGATHMGPMLSEVAADPAQFDLAVAALRSLSLLQRHSQTQTLSLHQLVRAVLREEMNKPEQHQWWQRVLHALNAVFPAVSYQTWGRCERLLPHVLAGAADIPAQFYEMELAQVLQKTASYLNARARFELAEQVFQRALSLMEQQVGRDHAEVAVVLNRLGTNRIQQGKYEQGEACYQRALTILEQSLHPDLFQQSVSLNGLAVLYFRQGAYAKAEALYQQALAIRQLALGQEHPAVAVSLTNLALLYAEQGLYEQAEPLHLRALRIRERVLDSAHPDLAFSLNNLAILYIYQQRYPEAEPFLQRAILIREQAQGPEHPELASPLHNLGILYKEQGRYGEAEALVQRARFILERALGENHPEVAYPLTELANLSLEQGKETEAAALYQQARSILEQALGETHPLLAEVLAGQARLRLGQGELVYAEELLQRALAIQEQQLGETHPDTAQTLHDLATLSLSQGRLSEAISFSERALAIRRHVLGDSHLQTVATRTLYVQLIQLRSDKEEGVSFAKPASEQPPAPSAPESDPLDAFLAACCELHPRAFCQSGELWQTYQRWARQHQERFPLSRRAFTVHLRAHGCRADRTKTARIWRGVTLLNQVGNRR